MTKPEWKTAYHAFRHAWYLNGVYWKAANAHGKRTVKRKEVDRAFDATTANKGLYQLCCRVRANRPVNIRNKRTAGPTYTWKHLTTDYKGTALPFTRCADNVWPEWLKHSSAVRQWKANRRKPASTDIIITDEMLCAAQDITRAISLAT